MSSILLWLGIAAIFLLPLIVAVVILVRNASADEKAYQDLIVRAQKEKLGALLEH